MRHFEPELRWRWSGDLDPVSASPPFRLLAAVRSNGSLRQAAKALGTSYRHAWGVLGAWEQRLGKPLVTLERGRGARLTALGEKLLWAERRAQARIAPELDRIADEFERALSAEFGAAAAINLTVRASHDLLLARVRDRLSWEPEFTLQVDFRGSLDSLADLWRGHCQLAGFHVPTPTGPGRPAEIGRWLKPRQHRAIRFAEREQGLMLAPGNPRGIAGLTDLVRPGVRFINRQRTSGTRILFDRLLDEAGIDARRIEGYGTEEFTHLAVAATVAGDGADCAFGIRAAAAQFGLDFIPIARESYALAFRRELAGHPGVQRLVAFLGSAEFQAMAERLPGYDPRGAGEIVEVDAFLGIPGSAGPLAGPPA
ncbi:MAG: substrate-binding domain-containing protein [Pseudomonadota bacterium]